MCVEGRKDQLSLHSHGCHAWRPAKRKALRSLHNSFIERSEGSTAAERFFGHKPADPFAWLLERFSKPPRPVEALAVRLAAVALVLIPQHVADGEGRRAKGHALPFLAERSSVCRTSDRSTERILLIPTRPYLPFAGTNQRMPFPVSVSSRE
jgi:hypothetical protein